MMKLRHFLITFIAFFEHNLHQLFGTFQKKTCFFCYFFYLFVQIGQGTGSALIDHFITRFLCFCLVHY